MTPATFDQARADAFAERSGRMLNEASLVLMMSIGHQTGLFQVMADLPPATSAQIAEAASLQERYVREWLGAMVTGRIVDYDGSTATYHLPAEHAGSLIPAAGMANVAVAMRLVPILAQVEDRIIDCFRNGGGVPYAAYPAFHSWGAESTKSGVDAMLLGSVVPAIPGLQTRLEAGIDIADIGCGSGHALNVLANAFPRSRFCGYDISGEAIARAQAEANQLGLSNVRFEVKDVATLDDVAAFDVITAFDSIHDQVHPRKVLKVINHALRPDGTFLMIDITASSDVGANLDHPAGPFLYTASCMHCMTVSLAHGGEGLGTMWGEQKACELLTEAGFAQVEVKHIPEDTFNTYYVAAKY